MSSLESEHRFLGSSTDDCSDINVDTVSSAVSAFVVLMTGTMQDSSLSPPLEEESISKLFQLRRGKWTCKKLQSR